jgi:hypothetical protein
MCTSLDREPLKVERGQLRASEKFNPKPPEKPPIRLRKLSEKINPDHPPNPQILVKVLGHQ